MLRLQCAGTVYYTLCRRVKFAMMVAVCTAQCVQFSVFGVWCWAEMVACTAHSLQWGGDGGPSPLLFATLSWHPGVQVTLSETLHTAPCPHCTLHTAASAHCTLPPCPHTAHCCTLHTVHTAPLSTLHTLLHTLGITLQVHTAHLSDCTLDLTVHTWRCVLEDAHLKMHTWQCTAHLFGSKVYISLCQKKQKSEFCLVLLGVLGDWYWDPTKQFSNL